MNGREPQIIIIGPPFKNKAGEMVTPKAFLHPCFKDGCREYAAWGFGELWACRAHVNEASTLFDHHRRIERERENEQGSTGDSGLFGR